MVLNRARLPCQAKFSLIPREKSVSPLVNTLLFTRKYPINYEFVVFPHNVHLGMKLVEVGGVSRDGTLRDFVRASYNLNCE